MTKTENKNDLAKKLKILRAEYDMTQAEVAKRLGISQQTYSKYESKNTVIDSETITKICELYGVSADYLLGIDSGKKKQTTSQTAATSEDSFDAILQLITELKRKGEK